MQIKSVTLRCFRNHESTTLKLSPGVNVLIGDNAQGKTNLLEAVYLTCVGRGWRTPRDRDMIKFGSDRASVKVIASKRFGDCSVEIALNSSQKKTVKINGVPVQKMGELMGTINCVFFSPDELRLIKEAPTDRRRFLDIDISQIDKVYFYNLVRYNKILQQRNALLKSIDKTTAQISGLDIWDEQLAVAGEIIIARRLKFVEQLLPEVCRIHEALAFGEHIEILYTGIEDFGQNVPRGTMHSALLAAREKDLRLKTTTVGPHRDDLRITVNGKDVRLFASQGQQRTVALSLKLAELKIFETITGEKPLLLLDDVLSELDNERQGRLLNAISDCQSIITATKFEMRDKNVSVFRIKGGRVVGKR